MLKQYMASFYDNDSELFKRDLCEQFHVSQDISFEQVIFFVYSRQLITSKTMLISLILLLTIYLIVSKDYNLDKILIKRFLEKKFSKGNIFLKDTELKTDNQNSYSLINNSLKWLFKMYWKPKQKLKKREIESLHKYQEIVRNSTLKN